MTTQENAVKRIQAIKAKLQREITISEYKKANNEARKDAQLIAETQDIWSVTW